MKRLPEIRKFSTFVRRLAGNEKGNVAIIFAASIIPVVGLLGSAVDYASALNQRTKMQASLDSAVIVAAKEYAASRNQGQALTKAQEQFNVSAKQSATGTISSSDFAGTTITLTATGYVPTSFMSVVGFNRIEISATSTASMAGKDLELSVMLDVTGSMSNDMADLRGAGQDLVDIILAPSMRPRRMAVVPFAHAVNVGSYFQTVTNMPQTYTTRKCKKRRRGSCKKWKTTTVTRSTCAVARRGTYKNSEVAPGPGRYFGSFDDERQYSNNRFIRYSSCRPSNAQIVPLTNDRQVLYNAMNGLQASGWTAGHIGTIWAWQMISPDWSSVWPAQSTPGTYDPGKLMKVAILMTDGQYNTWYRGTGSANQHAAAVCEAMKAKGIVVYTIGFDMTGQTTAINLLKQCATSNAHYFFPYNGQALRQVFRQIGAQIADGADGITLSQ